jgi:hypothetical protein
MGSSLQADASGPATSRSEVPYNSACETGCVLGALPLRAARQFSNRCTKTKVGTNSAARQVEASTGALRHVRTADGNLLVQGKELLAFPMARKMLWGSTKLSRFWSMTRC